MPSLPTNIPPLSTLLGGRSPARELQCNLVDLLYAYAYTMRAFNGEAREEEEDTVDAARCCGQLSAVLTHGAVHNSPSVAVHVCIRNAQEVCVCVCGERETSWCMLRLSAQLLPFVRISRPFTTLCRQHAPSTRPAPRSSGPQLPSPRFLLIHDATLPSPSQRRRLGHQPLWDPHATLSDVAQLLSNMEWVIAALADLHSLVSAAVECCRRAARADKRKKKQTQTPGESSGPSSLVQAQKGHTKQGGDFGEEAAAPSFHADAAELKKMFSQQEKRVWFYLAWAVERMGADFLSCDSALRRLRDAVEHEESQIRERETQSAAS